MRLRKKIGVTASITPNYTLISERGVKIFDQAEEIIAIFTEQRLKVVKRRYELLIKDHEDKIKQNNEIIRFIKEKHYEQAVKTSNRKTFVEYLNKKKFTYSDYLADMAIYRMTKEEVEKRALMVKEDTKKLKEFKRIVKSDTLIRDKLVEELQDVKVKLSKIMDDKERERKKLYEKLLKKKKK